MNDPMFQPVTSEWAPEAKIPGSPRISRGTFALTNVNPSPEASMRWVDYSIQKKAQNISNKDQKGFMGVPRKCGR